MPEDTEIAQLAAASAWGQKPSDISATDITRAKFPWASRHRFFMTMSSTRQRMLVCIDPERRPYAFEPVGNVRHLEKARFNALVINSVLSRENLELPMGLDLAWTLRNTLMGLGGWVACQEFLKAERDAIGMWTHPTPRTGTKLFEEHCIDPKLETRGNAWDLEFRYFNLQGGVEFWKAEGTRHQVGAYSAVEALPNGTFLVPYA